MNEATSMDTSMGVNGSKLTSLEVGLLPWKSVELTCMEIFMEASLLHGSKFTSMEIYIEVNLLPWKFPWKFGRIKNCMKISMEVNLLPWKFPWK